MIGRVRLASTPEDRFLALLDEIQGQIDALPDAAVRDVLAGIADLRRAVLGDLAGAEGVDLVRLTQLDAQLRDLGDRFIERYGTAVADAQGAMVTLGAELAARPLVAAGTLLHVPQLSRRQVEAAEHYQALLITHATDETIAQISLALRVGVLQGSSWSETLQRVAGSLTSPGPFQSLDARAEAITRTELGRIQSMATQAGLVETQRYVPDLQKQWRHAGRSRKWARPGHLEADGQVRAVAATFRVRCRPGLPYEELLYPRAATGSAANVVECGCSSIPYRAAWAGALDTNAA